MAVAIGAEPITWNEEMASVAQAWGAQCKWAHSYVQALHLARFAVTF
jgi:hypothetical protein